MQSRAPKNAASKDQDLYAACVKARRSASRHARANPRDKLASGAIPSNAWNAPGTTFSSTATPAASSRCAYSMSSGANRSMEPTPINAGGRPFRFDARAGTEFGGTTAEPARTPSKLVQPKRFDAGVHR
jgi:hypothetical protein